MAREHRGRPRGNLLPRPTQPEPPKQCTSFLMDIDHYNRTGEVIPLTDPEVYEQPDKSENDYFEIPASTKEEAERRKSYMASKKPSKEQLERDMKDMSRAQLSKHYEVSRSAVFNWLRSYGLLQQTESQVTPLQETPEEQPIQESVCERECQVVVEINELPPEPAEESRPAAPEENPNEASNLDEAWTAVKDNLVMIRAAYLQKAEREFEEKFRELMKAITGGDEVC